MTIWQKNLKFRRCISLSLLCAALCLLTTACFRDTSEVVDTQPEARAVASPTAIATEAPPPTATVALVEDLFTAEPPDTFALTATALIASLTEVAGEPATEIPAADESASDSAAAVADAPSVQATPIPLVIATAIPGEDCIHEIRTGETMFMLSLAYGISVDEIAAASEIDNPDRISVGQRITIPGCGTTGFSPPPTTIPIPTAIPSTVDAVEPVVKEVVEISEAADEAADQAGFSALVEQAQNAILNNAQAGAGDDFSAQAAQATQRPSYTVQPGDTLLGIALQFDTTIAELAAANNIEDVDNLQVGDVLQIP